MANCVVNATAKTRVRQVVLSKLNASSAGAFTLPDGSELVIPADTAWLMRFRVTGLRQLPPSNDQSIAAFTYYAKRLSGGVTLSAGQETWETAVNFPVTSETGNVIRLSVNSDGINGGTHNFVASVEIIEVNL